MKFSTIMKGMGLYLMGSCPIVSLIIQYHVFLNRLPCLFAPDWFLQWNWVVVQNYEAKITIATLEAIMGFGFYLCSYLPKLLNERA